MAPTLLVLCHPDIPVDQRILAKDLGAAASTHGWSVKLMYAPVAGLTEFSALHEPDAALIMPAPEEEVPPGISCPVVRFDLADREADLTSGLVHHLRGIGLDGLSWAVAAAVHASRSPADRQRYGSAGDQFIDLRRGSGEPTAVGVLLHGGFYRSRWGNFLMDGLAIDLAARGWVGANVEYRRPDRHGWQATLADVRRALEWLSVEFAAPLVIIGHSAGGQLALQAGQWELPRRPRLCVSLTGVVDLVAAHDRRMGEDAVAQAMGAPSDVPDLYREASPMLFPHRSADWLLVETDGDSHDLIEMNCRLASSATLGAPELLMSPGDHFSVIDASSVAWRSTIDRIGEILSP